ncbi:hypothetical protein [Cellulomonas sp. C5510]|uniref:hypothetical protein n=1 Tax=Cellulomonas sp. C5510 TaxID=2871170 RepID=UPI001C98A4C4|nr:hypothetical protein [Cellulomonas sp. C5510]QZN87035.1 hypothetical protein K5O09_07985 [Cellulomonas sp. C5510]
MSTHVHGAPPDAGPATTVLWAVTDPLSPRLLEVLVEAPGYRGDLAMALGVPVDRLTAAADELVAANLIDTVHDSVGTWYRLIRVGLGHRMST